MASFLFRVLLHQPARPRVPGVLILAKCLPAPTEGACGMIPARNVNPTASRLAPSSPTRTSLFGRDFSFAHLIHGSNKGLCRPYYYVPLRLVVVNTALSEAVPPYGRLPPLPTLRRQLNIPPPLSVSLVQRGDHRTPDLINLMPAHALPTNPPRLRFMLVPPLI